TKRAKEIAAATVNKERARKGEAKSASRSSIRDISSGRRGGLRSGSGSGGRTKEQLYNEAKRRGIKGRSRMNKAQLQRAVAANSRRLRPRPHGVVLARPDRNRAGLRAPRLPLRPARGLGAAACRGRRRLRRAA